MEEIWFPFNLILGTINKYRSCCPCPSSYSLLFFEHIVKTIRSSSIPNLELLKIQNYKSLQHSLLANVLDRIALCYNSILYSVFPRLFWDFYGLQYVFFLKHIFGKFEFYFYTHEWLK